MTENMHHIFYQRRLWNKSENGARIRQSCGLIVPMDAEIHKELHYELLGGVPLLGGAALKSVLQDFERKDTYFGCIDSVMLAIHRTEDPMKDLALNALEAQLPFIRDGITRLHLPRQAMRRSVLDRKVS